jgi:CheY-like chemotaxis protein
MRDLETDCRFVSNGLDAVEAALGSDFDAILMDMEMPLMDGYEAARVLREHGYTKPILAFTAHHDRAEVERAVREGCNGVLTKPTTVEKLRAALLPLFRRQATASAAA